ncbi:TetR/AcrR family transcriptional regulator [Sphingobium sp. 15-1]|uniref:TetR/AcrR family transcriptional regulator n=2 Tax=Sphingomonadaceae TaxID=41297 RepID=UPI00082CA2B0|nr:TetR/AcrR family transcriptional regulator [Sphingobium sp. 15-1]NML87862.1 TetR/AcrR family transcriptional regulator [Sphingobium sp. TB-6]
MNLQMLDRPQRTRGRPALNAAQAVDEDKLLGLAFSTFAERGYEGTTLRDLSKRLGVSHNLLNVRFGRKEDLWIRAVDWRMAQASPFVEAAFDEPADPEVRLRHLIQRFCLWATSNGDIVSLTNVEGCRSTWRLDHIVEHFVLPFQRRLDGLLDAVRLQRPVHGLSTAALMALLVQGVGYYFCAVPMQQRLGAGQEVDDMHAAEHADRLAAFLLAALLPPVA